MPSASSELHRWRVIGIIAALVIILVPPAYVLKERSGGPSQTDPSPAPADFVGRQACIACHETEYLAWQGSDHDHAMAAATDSTVLGDFDDALFQVGDVSARFFKRDGKYYVRTRGEGEAAEDFEIAYTFGVEPLQQYLIPFPGGRLQSLTIAWDTERQEWFTLYPDQDIPPDDWLHWTQGAQNWNGMCAECHSTNLIKNYDPATKTFATTWSEINVSCEACHGPSSRHVAWAEIPPMARPEVENYELVIRTSGVSSRQQVELCGPCHSRRRELGDYDHTRGDLLDNIVPSILEEQLYHADGQILDEVYVYGSFLQSKMYHNDVHCGDCHDVHSLELKKPDNELCLQCHQTEVYDSYDHHFHKREHEGQPSDGHLCVKCHMPEQPYMIVDWRADHSLRVPRPDLTLEIGVPNACSQIGCHDDKPVEWSAEHYAIWYGQARKPHYGAVLAAGRAREPEAREQLIRLAGDELQPAIVRATALSLLGAFPGVESTAAFERGLADEESLVRYTAIRQFRASDPEELVQLVVPLLFDDVKAVRMEAAVKLAGMPDELLKDYQRAALTEALDEYVLATEYSLDFAFAGYNLGNLYLQLDETDKAEGYYRAAIEIDDLFYPAKVNLATLYNAAGRNDQAERLLREVVGDYPEEYEAAYSLGLLLAEMGRMEEAALYLRQAARGIPARARIRYNLGLIEQQLGNVADAETQLVEAVELEPENLDYLYALADFYVKAGNLREAMEIADRMIEAYPGERIGHEIRAYIEQLSR
jgi:tetratricopeptide (TPR) repeat protein